MRSLIKFFMVFLILAIPSVVALFTIIPVLFAILPTFLPFIAIFALVHLLDKERKRTKIRSQISPGSNLCPYCITPVGEREIICRHCYEDLVINCSNCGQIINREAKKCPQCGISLLSETIT